METRNYVEIHNEVAEKYGEPYSINKQYEIRQLNSHYFAAFFLILYLPIYLLNGATFYLYSETSGFWEQTTRQRMLDLVGRFIHKYSLYFNEPDISEKRTRRFCEDVLEYLKGVAEAVDIFNTGYSGSVFVHCLNTMLVFDELSGKWQEEKFSQKFLSRQQIPIVFNKTAQCPRFLDRLLKSAISEDDIAILQLYVGQCLLGRNHSQTFLILTGTAGGGKSTLLNVIEGVIGPGNCTELRLEHIGGRFEVGRYRGKHLLMAKDVSSSFLQLKTSKRLKALIGDDRVTTEYKNLNSVMEIKGDFSVILTMNAIPIIEFDDDLDAWRRRVLWIKFERAPTSEKIVHFDEILIREEGSGILNWALEGAAKLLKAGGKIIKSTEQEARVAQLIAYSQPFEIFANKYIHPVPKASLTTSGVIAAFSLFCRKVGCPIPPDRKLQHMFHEHMRSKFGAVSRNDIKRNGKSNRGYVGYLIKESTRYAESKRKDASNKMEV